MIKKQGLYLPEFERDNCGAGFICNLQGTRSNRIIHDAIKILNRLEHRGAVSFDGITGDGAGILIEIPHNFFNEEVDFDLPSPQDYAVGMVFLPKNNNQAKYCKKIIQKNIKKQGLKLLGWRKVPTDNNYLGTIAKNNEPQIEQIFISKKENELSHFDFKIKLYALRKISEHQVTSSNLSQEKYFYFASLSTTTIIYKGLLIPEDIKKYYLDLNNEKLVSRFAIVHQRFSTNTFPSWHLAQPFRYLCHNGEINTLRGNLKRMLAREELMDSPLFGNDMKQLFHIIDSTQSDSACLDMAVELLLMTGRSLPEAMMMVIPEAWEKDPFMDKKKKAFYQYNSCIMEPWDGPASIPFTDGHFIGALLDRNGLRPSRYTVTKDGYVIMSSESGVLDTQPENVLKHGRLEPGRMFLVDMDEGRIVEDQEVKEKIASKYPYEEWIDKNLLHLSDIKEKKYKPINEKTNLLARKVAFGYTHEEIKKIINPMATMGKEPIGSMGNDTPLAVLSDKPQLLYNYFKHLFAQVTNPPLDGIREEIVTDFSLLLGSDKNIFDISDEHCKKLLIENPVISNLDLQKIKNIQHPEFKSDIFPCIYDVKKGLNEIEAVLKSIVKNIIIQIEKGTNIIILSDRNIDNTYAPIPMLLVCSYINKELSFYRKRSLICIIVESAEPREPHHFATLFGYGASAVNPYIINEIIKSEVDNGHIINTTEKEAIENYNKAIAKGVMKIMNKIGISTLHSYRTSQIFEIIGLKDSFVKEYFPGTPSRIEGVGLYELEKEIFLRHRKAFIGYPNGTRMNIGGDYRWRRKGEKHNFNPISIAKLQQAVRNNNKDSYDTFSKDINLQNEQLMTIRGMLEFTNLNPIPIEEVEPWTEIVKRFKTGAMSYGSISEEAHTNLAIAMNRIGGKSNSGEGGENKNRLIKDNLGNSKSSKIKQVASGRFGVSIGYLTNAEEIQIKMAQGAKPGEGGHLPGSKVYPWIAECRNSTPYVGLISPPPHHDIYSIEDLAQLIFDLKNANRAARINVKLVSKVGVGIIAAGVAKAKADVILISGYDGGTGAAPLTSLRHAGLPWELGIAEAQQTLVLNNLRNRVKIECDGQLKTGRDVAIACLLGAEEFGFATAPLVASGCIMMRACHTNTCPVGIATQDPELRKNFKGKPEHVINYMYFVAQELREIMAQLGFRTINEMVGQAHKLSPKKTINHYKAKGLDLSPILHMPITKDVLHNTHKQDHNIDDVLDFKILKIAHPAIYMKEKMELEFPIKNTDRSVGAILSNELSKLYGENGFPSKTLQITFNGTAGQSFGAFAIKGLSLMINGSTNDYLGKSLSGATLIIKKPDSADFTAHENIITGNVALYGAISGYAFINGIAGERFCVRNSGVMAVVEGVGDHCCEYMTGGTVVVLGKTGRNFGAGMSGGIAYVLDQDGKFSTEKCNKEMIDLEPLEESDEKILNKLITQHQDNTNSDIALEILSNWNQYITKFIKVMPKEYKIALKRMNEEKNNLKKIVV